MFEAATASGHLDAVVFGFCGQMLHTKFAKETRQLEGEVVLVPFDAFRFEAGDAKVMF